MKYRVIARRTTIYELEAPDREAAETGFTDDHEVDGETHEITGHPLCPTCEEPLTSRTTRGAARHGEPNYCDTCDREIGEEEWNG